MNKTLLESVREVGIILVLFILILFLFALQYFVTNLGFTGKAVAVGESYPQEPPVVHVEAPSGIALSPNLRCWKNTGIQEADIIALGYLLEKADCTQLQKDAQPSLLAAHYADGCFFVESMKVKSQFCPSGTPNASFEVTGDTLPSESAPVLEAPGIVSDVSRTGIVIATLVIVAILLLMWREYELRHVIHGPPEKKKAPVLVMPRYTNERPVVDVHQIQTGAREHPAHVVVPKKIELPNEDVDRFVASCKKAQVLAEQGNFRDGHRVYFETHRLFSRFLHSASKEQRMMMSSALRAAHQKLAYADNVERISVLTKRLESPHTATSRTLPEIKREKPIEDVLSELKSHRQVESRTAPPVADENITEKQHALEEMGKLLADIAAGKPGSVERYREWKLRRRSQ